MIMMILVEFRLNLCLFKARNDKTVCNTIELAFYRAHITKVYNFICLSNNIIHVVYSIIAEYL